MADMGLCVRHYLVLGLYLTVIALFTAPTAVCANEPIDLQTLLVLSEPGQLSATDIPEQTLWLDVSRTGLYQVVLDGPGLIGLAGFRTANGRSDGNDRVERLGLNGSPYRVGMLDDLLLESGRSYMLQIAAESPRGVTLFLREAFDETLVFSGDAIPGSQGDTPLRLEPGMQLLLRPEGSRTLKVMASTARALNLELIAPPPAEVSAVLQGAWIGTGGLFPLVLTEPADLRVDSRKGLDDRMPLVLLRASAVEDADAYDEIEPGDTDIGALPLNGRVIDGVLRAKTDKDGYLFTLDRPARLDLSVQVADGGEAALTLHYDAGAGLREVLTANAPDGALSRRALAFDPGHYRLDISGNRSLPSDYQIVFRPTQDGRGSPDGEPDDYPHLAQTLLPGEALTGILGDDNPGHIRFDVPEPGHLWELRGVQGLRDVALTDGNDRAVGTWQTPSGAVVLKLALPPGQYVARLRGNGPYALRLTDLGPRPQGSETEPNDAPETAQRLSPGNRFVGDFQTTGDLDVYEIVLPAAMPLTLTMTGPDDGMAIADLELTETGRHRAELRPENRELTYSALFPAGRQTLTLRAGEDGISGRYSLRLDRAVLPEENEPKGVAALPGNGRLSGRIGGFDDEDRIFVPLPEGGGRAVFTCFGAIEHWSVFTYGDEKRLIRAAAGQIAVLDYSEELGGAVEVRLGAGPPVGDYTCRVAFQPSGATGTTLTHVEEADDAAPMVVVPGQQVDGIFTDATDADRIAIKAPLNTLAGFRCAISPGQLRAVDGDGLRASLQAEPLSDGTYPFAGSDLPQVLQLSPDRERSFPQDWRCIFVADPEFRTPAQMGPAAPFTGFQDTTATAETSYDPAAALAAFSAGRPDWLNPEQTTSDLDLTLQISGLDTAFRAYSRSGQAADLVLSVTNPNAADREVSLDLSVLADGWRLTPATGQMLLAAGASADLPLHLELPPMQSPIDAPQIMVAARAGSQQTASLMRVQLDALAAEQAPFRFWTAPRSLRGGLNPMQYQLGARLVMLDDEVLDEDAAEKWSFLHDGAAPHTAIQGWFRARQATFKLAESAPIAGMVVHLRSASPRGDWPDTLRLELSGDGETWQPVLTADLTASDLPQIFALPEIDIAAFARITRSGCRAAPDCDAMALAEVGLIAAPDWRLSAPMDIADPLLGGHVVAGRDAGAATADERAFGGKWNDDLLSQHRASDLRESGGKRGDGLEAIIGFQSGRAGRISAVEWVGHPDDKERLAQADLAVSITGPAGPWQAIDPLPAPPEDALSSRLDLADPVWARAVRLTFRRDPEKPRALPDRIRIWEDPTAPPILGLWEDDRPDAGYEATVAPPASNAPAPAGGPTQDAAVPLMLGRDVTSSVQLERNADWWRLDIPVGPSQELSMRFENAAQPEFTTQLIGPDGNALALMRDISATGDLILSARAAPGTYHLKIEEPPRSVAILWDTSGSVSAFVPMILDAVRLWAQSLEPGRDRLQLLPFGNDEMLLRDWAGRPEDIYPVLAQLPANGSSDAETAMGLAAEALAAEDGQRGIVVITDAETSQSDRVWGPLLRAAPRVVALSVDSSDTSGVRVLKDWTTINGGLFYRVTGNAGLADGLDLAAALFRAPKGYNLTVSATELREPEGEGQLVLKATKQTEAAAPGGGIEVILDASGSMLQRMPDGQRRITVAHDALAGLVRDTLPPGTPFAFRAFGLEKDACRSELVVPFQPLDPTAAETAIRSVPAVNLARTAIAASLAAAAEDLASLPPPRVVVLLTDGDETCDGDVGSEIERIREAGLDLRLTIVGFAIDDAGLAATFADWAEAGGGRYLPAGDPAELAATITEAIAPRYSVERLFVDGRQADAGVIGLDDLRTLAAGRYRLQPLQTATGVPVEIDLSDGQMVNLLYDPVTGLAEQGGVE